MRDSRAWSEVPTRVLPSDAKPNQDAAMAGIVSRIAGRSLLVVSRFESRWPMTQMKIRAASAVIVADALDPGGLSLKVTRISYLADLRRRPAKPRRQRWVKFWPNRPRM